MNAPLAPFTTTPHLVEKVWGGRRLAPERDAPVGEAWLVADLDAGASDTSLGDTLRDVQARRGGALSRCTAAGRFPLLVKIIDAAQDLSVQVHPNASVAATIPGAASKEETWIVLDAAPDATVLYGLRPATTRTDFAQALDAGHPEEAMQRIAVRAGDVLHIAPGTLHAICGGVTLLEIQEPSDTTFRVWDYNRPGLDGKPRPLHRAEAFAALVAQTRHPAPLPPAPRPSPAGLRLEEVIRAERYRIERVHAAAARTVSLPPGPVRVLVPLDADALLIAANAAPLAVNARGAAVLPEGQTATVRVTGTLIVAAPIGASASSQTPLIDGGAP